ncbi:MAG: Eco57I restriction-modification methylase domain-containing protein, partial [Ktedonobacterales bacterium]
LTTGLSRPPIVTQTHRDDATLADFATTMRGIATGANEFFFLTREQEQRTGIPATFFRTAIGRTRDVPEAEISENVLARLETLGRPTRLLALDSRAIDQFPPAIREYLRYGEKIGLPKKSLISQRKPWYKMETRPVPPFLFAYLGRRSARFIRNSAGVLPLTGFLCVYPHSDDPTFLKKLWAVLQHPDTIALLPRVGKSYGSGAIKVEPRALELLPIPSAVLREVGLTVPVRLKQAALL